MNFNLRFNSGPRFNQEGNYIYNNFQRHAPNNEQYNEPYNARNLHVFNVSRHDYNWAYPYGRNGPTAPANSRQRFYGNNNPGFVVPRPPMRHWSQPINIHPYSHNRPIPPLHDVRPQPTLRQIRYSSSSSSSSSSSYRQLNSDTVIGVPHKITEIRAYSTKQSVRTEEQDGKVHSELSSQDFKNDSGYSAAAITAPVTTEENKIKPFQEIVLSKDTQVPNVLTNKYEDLQLTVESQTIGAQSTNIEESVKQKMSIKKCRSPHSSDDSHKEPPSSCASYEKKSLSNKALTGDKLDDGHKLFLQKLKEISSTKSVQPMKCTECPKHRHRHSKSHDRNVKLCKDSKKRHKSDVDRSRKDSGGGGGRGRDASPGCNIADSSSDGKAANPSVFNSISSDTNVNNELDTIASNESVCGSGETKTLLIDPHDKQSSPSSRHSSGEASTGLFLHQQNDNKSQVKNTVDVTVTEQNSTSVERIHSITETRLVNQLIDTAVNITETGVLSRPMRECIQIADVTQECLIGKHNSTTSHPKTNTEAFNTDTQAAKTDTETVKTDTETVKTDTETVKTDTEAVKSDTEAVKSDTEAVKTDTEAVKTDTEAVKTDIEVYNDSSGGIGITNINLLKTWKLGHVDPVEFKRKLNAVVSHVASIHSVELQPGTTTEVNSTSCDSHGVENCERMDEERRKDDRGVFKRLEDSLQSLNVNDIPNSPSSSRSARPDCDSPRRSPDKLLAGINNLKKLLKDSPARVASLGSPRILTPDSDVPKCSSPSSCGVSSDTKMPSSRNIWDQLSLTSRMGKDGETQNAVSAQTPDHALGTNFLSCGSSFDNDEDALFADDDSDDDLMETPSILKSLNEACNRPAPSTPTKCQLSATHGLDSSFDSTSPIFLPVSTSVTTNITLESLLAFKRNKIMTEKDLGPKEAVLKNSLANGGVKNMSFHVENDELPEGEVYQLALDRFLNDAMMYHVVSSPRYILISQHRVIVRLIKSEAGLRTSVTTITSQHPGEVIFHHERYLQLFNTSNLTLESCGFTNAPKSGIDKCLASLDYEMLDEFLCGDFVLLCIDQVSTPEPLLNWLFKLVSIHDDSSVIRSSFHILYWVLMQGKCENWKLSVKDISDAFVNYGASLETIVPDSGMLESLRTEESKENSNSVLPAVDNEFEFELENLISVIQVISYAIQKRSHLYSEDEFFMLLVMLCKVAVDESLTMDVLKYDFQACISIILDAFTPDAWTEKLPLLINLLSNLCEHHHNKVQIVRLMPHGARGYCLQRAVGLASLRRLLYTDNPNSATVQITDLQFLMNRMKDQFDDDFYWLSSMLQLIDLCIGNETLPIAEKDPLYILTDMARNLMSEMRDNMHMIDCTKVKDLLVRLISKWTFMQQAMSSVGLKRTLFSYFIPPVKDNINEENKENIDQSVEVTESVVESMDNSADSNSDNF